MILDNIIFPLVYLCSNCDLAICDFGLARGISIGMSAKLTEYVSELS